jgi:hypothetical protein
LKKKGFKEERVTKVGLDAIGTSTTLESNKSHRRLAVIPSISLLSSAIASHRAASTRPSSRARAWRAI